jgi:hypothetical protein
LDFLRSHQLYLGRGGYSEAICWVNTLHGK